MLTQAKEKEEGWPEGTEVAEALSGVGMFPCWRALHRDQDRPDPWAKAHVRFSRVKSRVLSLAHNSLQCYRLGERDWKAPQQEGLGTAEHEPRWATRPMAPGQ